ncbi:reverse transcriptase N-terminal domain-containing protein [Flaviflexus huanghaiensis]|uniref:reverse transcriptase N-terminal domain-containing protein n=1 Tax=Flaviflexus huanghaiensis TaxID=1111473 RepID=UPI0019D640A1
MRTELRRMLDATANRSTDDNFDWWADINWSQTEAHVRALRQRIFTAAQEANPKRVRNLQPPLGLLEPDE